MPSTPKQDTTRTELEEHFGAKGADIIDARIRKLSAEEAAKLIKPINDRLSEVVEAQRANIAAAKKSGDSEAAQATNEATDKVKEAAKAANDVTSKANDGKSVSEQEIEDASLKEAEAKEAVDKAAAKVGKSKSGDDESSSGDSSDHERRITALEQSRTRHRACIDQLEAGQHDLQVVSATAFAHAQAGDSTHAMRRAGLAALIAFVATFVVYVLFVFGPVNWDWNWAVGLPAVVAGIVGAIVFARSQQDGPATTSVAAANAIVGRWADNAQPDDDDDEDDHPVPGVRQQPTRSGSSASAGAHASAR